MTAHRSATAPEAHASDLAQIVDRCLGGDPEALEDLLSTARDRVYRLAVRMTACREDAEDATQEILIKVLTHLGSYRGEAAPMTWIHRIAVNHLLDRRKSPTERLGLTFDAFAKDLLDGLADPEERSDPARDLLADEVRRGCTLALLTCLDRDLRVAYVLGEILDVPSSTGAEICEISEVAYRKRLSRARGRVRSFLEQHCGLVNPDAPCHCRRRVPAALASGRIDLANVSGPGLDPATATAELEALYDAGQLMRAHPAYRAPERITEEVTAFIRGRRFAVLDRDDQPVGPRPGATRSDG